jgi:hypothetical protein
MDDVTSDRSNMPNGKASNVRGRSTTLRGGHDPSNLGRLSGKARREKAHARKADAELSKLTLRAQHAVTAQRKLGDGRLADIYDGLIQVALHGQSEHARVSACKLLLDLAQAAVEDEPTDPDSKAFDDMTPAERIALYVRLDKVLREESSDVIEPGDGEQADPTGATFPRGVGGSRTSRVGHGY